MYFALPIAPASPIPLVSLVWLRTPLYPLSMSGYACGNRALRKLDDAPAPQITSEQGRSETPLEGATQELKH
jgi:hypothetical protein